ncbi:hypothetical protein DPMN_020806 [Dreissena polymorpha]|uniref:Uncharacterized protein n=1 Tax=Dreissena polymorpha TaxID=45954 RepID=A0A9D4NHG1_DREPO|nr:hypothetical protein DPMN_020806 [Dreissena polymorpha]
MNRGSTGMNQGSTGYNRNEPGTNGNNRDETAAPPGHIQTPAELRQRPGRRCCPGEFRQSPGIAMVHRLTGALPARRWHLPGLRLSITGDARV